MVVPGSQEERTYEFQQNATWLWTTHGAQALTALYEQFAAMTAPTAWDQAQARWLKHTIEQVYGAVVSGHGAINKTMLLKHTPVEGTRRRGGGTTFALPQGVHLVFYAPDGVLLEQQVANAVERGARPAIDDVILEVNGGSTTKPVPKPYPIVLEPGQQAENYTVSPPIGLTVRGAAVTVDEPTLLSELVSRIAASGGGVVHFACCLRQPPGKAEYSGYYLRFRTPTDR